MPSISNGSLQPTPAKSVRPPRVPLTRSYSSSFWPFSREIFFSAQSPTSKRPAAQMQRRKTQPVYTPSATYRLQFNRLFPFDQATAIVDYLDDLGITDIYASPFLMARPGSLHGYDVTDETR